MGGGGLNGNLSNIIDMGSPKASGIGTILNSFYHYYYCFYAYTFITVNFQ